MELTKENIETPTVSKKKKENPAFQVYMHTRTPRKPIGWKDEEACTHTNAARHLGVGSQIVTAQRHMEKD